MYSTVVDQAARLGEGLVTGGADEGFISCVCPLVNLEVTRLRESLVTLGTGINFLSDVGFHASL